MPWIASHIFMTELIAIIHHSELVENQYRIVYRSILFCNAS